MLISELDCSADCTFSSCSGKGNCTCSCSWFKCTCKEKEQSIDPQDRVSMNKEQYEKTKLLALILKSLDENESYELLSNMVNNLKNKDYESFHENREQFIHNLMNLSDEKKETVNNYFSVINAKERV